MLNTLIIDGNATRQAAHVIKVPGATKYSGLITLQERLLQFNPEIHPFLNDTFGTAMNQNVSFGGVPEIIHNGGTSVEWTGSAIAGTWNFADAGKISLTNGNNGDTATFAEETPATIDMSGRTTLTGKINLTTYNTANNSLGIVFDNAGTEVGNSVNIDDYIDTGLLGIEQNFIIPKIDLGLTTQLIDGFTITLARVGGAKPSMTFDDIQLEATGVSAVFKVTTPKETRFHITEIRITIADALSGIVTVAGATENATMISLSYDQILGVSALSNGIVFNGVQKEKTSFAVVLKQIGDFLEIGCNIVGAISDGTNTFITLLIEFPEPITLEGGDDSFLSFTINDDLSPLLQFTAFARGAIEV